MATANAVNFQELELGGLGFTHESGTTAITGRFHAITALADTVFSSLIGEEIDGDSLASMPLPSGVTIFGRFTAFTLTSGRVIAYKMQ